MDGWTTRMKNASCHGCWQCGGMIKYFRANQRMRWTLPRTVIRKLLLCSRHATNNISSSLLVHHRGTMTMWWESETRSEIKECWPQAHLIHLIGVQKKNNLPSLVFQVHSFGKHAKRKDILFSLSFPLTLLWTGFQTHCLFPKRINSPRERKLKIKTVVPSLCPAST